MGTIHRVEPLDWLRGLMAISIMIYHLASWHFTRPDASTLLGVLGIYGVGIFFVLSGLSMAIVYGGVMSSAKEASTFFVRRLFRIWPLLWVCVALALIPQVARGNEVSLVKVLLNVTTLFGFVAPGEAINTGAWSIGNEMVYYALTPAILVAYHRGRATGNALLAVAFAISLVFSHHLLDQELPLSEQWGTYINPFNNLFLYVAGVAIHYNLAQAAWSRTTQSLVVSASILTFLACPAAGDQAEIVAGANRIALSAASILLVIAFYKFDAVPRIPRGVRRPLEQLGLATYGVYMLHPIVNTYVQFALKRMGPRDPLALSAAVVALTIVAALLSYHLFEKRVMRLGKRLTSS